MQLSLTKNRTPAQEKKYQSLLRKKGELVGPARPFLREYAFGPKAWCTKRAVKPTSWWRASSTSLG
ncbi:MAG: hypothetical protein DI536_01665 [Archangium gephyra]|uniref:Uncharacterized protein n=1 Tax=Archangium gephyra TaxID=48 RepID=A0A2W5VSG4_9BACT|nr:MAG: hypothetical protein DI536_01665 [Archangium gephyra]